MFNNQYIPSQATVSTIISTICLYLTIISINITVINNSIMETFDNESAIYNLYKEREENIRRDGFVATPESKKNNSIVSCIIACFPTNPLLSRNNNIIEEKEEEIIDEYNHNHHDEQHEHNHQRDEHEHNHHHDEHEHNHHHSDSEEHNHQHSEVCHHVAEEDHNHDKEHQHHHEHSEQHNHDHANVGNSSKQ